MASRTGQDRMSPLRTAALVAVGAAAVAAALFFKRHEREDLHDRMLDEARRELSAGLFTAEESERVCALAATVSEEAFADAMDDPMRPTEAVRYETFRAFLLARTAERLRAAGDDPLAERVEQVRDAFASDED